MNIIAAVNESTVLTDEQVVVAIAGIDHQIHRDLKPAWGSRASIRFYPRGTVPLNAWMLVIMDDSDQADALGYHDVTRTGRPLGKVFAKTDMEFGLSWTVTASHEVIEMLLNPQLENTVFDQSDIAAGTLYARELCDPCEADLYSYKVHGVQVSDFVLPPWFYSGSTEPGTRYDFVGFMTRPLQLLPGGYISIFEIPNDGNGWSQLLHDEQRGLGMRAPEAPQSARRFRQLRDRVTGCLVKSVC
jgi:hypothetical protein